MLNKQKIIGGFIILILLIVIVIYQPWIDEKVGVMIPYGFNIQQIGNRLYEKGVVISPIEFIFWGKILGKEREVKAGYYRLRRRTPAFFILPVLTRGSQEFMSITIPEGLRVKDVALLLEERELVDRDDFLKLVYDTVFIRKLGLSINSLEGFLFPDTYYLDPAHPNQSLSIIEMMVQNFFKNTKELKMGDSLYPYLIMASIIEKEARLDTERPIISAVFWNRLRLHRPIESCATVLYALDWRKTNLLESDLKIDSPYNTYRYPGLPPGPICSPGLKSIVAACYPDTSSYLYFVARGDGGHIFSRTYQDHIQAKMMVNRYGKR